MIRIQLSKNYQVVELTFNSLKDGEFDEEELSRSVDLVNRLGDLIDPTPKVAYTAPKIENPPTESQLALCKKLHLDVRGKDKEQVRKMIQEVVNK